MFSTVGVYHDKCEGRGGYHDARGGYHEYRGGVQYRGGNLLLFEYPYGTKHPHGTHVIPTFIMISPTVLNIPHGTQDIPHMHHVIPARY